jgi:hypothetical protein
MSIDLWEDAESAHEAMQRQAALDLADRHLEGVMPFVLAARTPAEAAHRLSLAGDSIAEIALRCGVDPGELFATAARRYELYREALAEGTDPLDTVVNATHPQGSGPEKPDEHDTGPAPGAYSEVPPGPEKGPVSQVTQVRPPQAGPVTEATAARHQADAGDYLAQTPPDLGTGMGSVDLGVDPGTGSIPAGSAGAQQAPLPAGVGQVTSSRDPVLRQVLAVAAVVQAQNPGLADEECRRLARKTVGQFLTADLDSSVMADDPGSGGGGGHGGGGTGPLGHALEGQGIRSMLPGGGGGGAAGAGAVSDLAEVAAL